MFNDFLQIALRRACQQRAYKLSWKKWKKTDASMLHSRLLCLLFADSIINNSCSVSCMFNASSNCLQETSSLIYIEKVQVCTLLNASVAVAAVDKPSAIMRMWQLASEAYWTVWKLIRWKLSVGLNNSL